MILVVDASVAAKWVLPEKDADIATALRDGAEALIAPDLIVAEVGSAVWKRARRKELSRGQAREAISLASGLLSQLHPIPPLAEHALELAIDLKHPIYDCFYLALALRENATLVTADARMSTAAKEARVKVRML